MCSDKMSSFKCILAGIGAGVAVGVVGKTLMDTNKRVLKKKAGKMVSAMENLADSAKDLFK